MFLQIISQNEERKAEKLQSLMDKLDVKTVNEGEKAEGEAK